MEKYTFVIDMNQVLSILSLFMMLVSIYLIRDKVPLKKIPVFSEQKDAAEGVFMEMMKFISFILQKDGLTLEAINFMGFLGVLVVGLLFLVVYFHHELIRIYVSFLCAFLGVNIHFGEIEGMNVFVFVSIFLIIMVTLLMFSFMMIAFHKVKISKLSQH
jgi:hypothetical protein